VFGLIKEIAFVVGQCGGKSFTFWAFGRRGDYEFDPDFLVKSFKLFFINFNSFAL
jgi:hypothetical protein